MGALAATDSEGGQVTRRTPAPSHAPSPVTEDPFVLCVEEAFGDLRIGDRIIVDTEADSPYALWRRLPGGCKSASEVIMAWNAGRLRLECGSPPATVEDVLSRLKADERESTSLTLRLVR
jgi:hypothetical protein